MKIYKISKAEPKTADPEQYYVNEERHCQIIKIDGGYKIIFDFNGHIQTSIAKGILTNEQKNTIAFGHGRKIYECGHGGQCRCGHGSQLPIQYIQESCYDCKQNKTRDPYHSLDMHDGINEDDGW